MFVGQIWPLRALGPPFFWPLRSGYGSLRWTHWSDIGFEECSPWFLKLSAVLVFGGQIWPPRASGPPFFWPLRSDHGSLRWTHWSDIGFEECSPWCLKLSAVLVFGGQIWPPVHCGAYKHNSGHKLLIACRIFFFWFRQKFK